MNYELILAIFIFGFCFWLGLYLVSRDYRSGLLWLSGVSLLAFSLHLMLVVLDNYAPTIVLAQTTSRLQRAAMVVSGLFWLLFLLKLVPNAAAFRRRISRNGVVLLLLLMGTAVYTTGMTLIQLNVQGLSPIAISNWLALTLLLMGTAVAKLDASEKGEALWAHYLRSLDYSFFTALIFGGQVVLVMKWGTGVHFAMLILLFGTIATAVIVQTFSSRLTRWVDGIAFFNFPKVRQVHQMLRVGADVAARVDDTLDLSRLPNDEFARLTRRALSQMGNLPKLAANPLTQLPLVTQRLSQQGVQIDTLSRATMLKQLLTESIVKLKPNDAAEFGATDEWRHYNALYFPYVMGIRPYRRRLDDNGLAAAAQEATEWFRQEVPPRTLYNWQNAAARLIANNLRERGRGANG